MVMVLLSLRSLLHPSYSPEVSLKEKKYRPDFTCSTSSHSRPMRYGMLTSSRNPHGMFDTSSRTCVLLLAASKLYAENHVGRLHMQHGSPFARLRTRVLDRREKWTSFVSCSSRQPSHQHIVSGFQERDTIAAGTSSRGDPFACRARSAGLPLVTGEQTALVTAAGDPATRPSRRAAQATKG